MKIKERFKKIFINSIGFVIGTIIFCTVAVSATSNFILASNEVEYDNTLSGASATTVRQALDYLNNKADTLIAEKESNVEYIEYDVGETVTVKNESYHVIAASPSNQDYVVLFKDDPLTVSEVNAYKIGTDNINHVNRNTGHSVGEAYNQNGYGGMAFYSSDTCGAGVSAISGCASSYSESDIKHVVDRWADDKFGSSELKSVNSYKARLISYNELTTDLGCTSNNCSNSSYNWTYGSNYYYWTMTLYNSPVSVWVVNSLGILSENTTGWASAYQGVVRPVINLKKERV